MRTNQKINVLRIVFFIVTVFFLFACKTSDEPNDPTNTTDTTDPTPNVLVKPVILYYYTTNVTQNVATIEAWVKPNEADTKISCEFKSTTETTWQSKTLPNTSTGKDSIKVTFDLTNLTTNTQYLFRIKSSNKAGEVVSIENPFSTYIVTDNDHNLYHVIKIGTQMWLQENLRTAHYANGDEIPYVPESIAWQNLGYNEAPGFCYYNNDFTISQIYGALYNWYAATDSRGFISGFHLPSAEEYKTLETFLGGEFLCAAKLDDASGRYWKEEITYYSNGQWTYNVPRTNSSGFTALPSGTRNASFYYGEGSFFGRLGTNCYLITSSVDNIVGPVIFETSGGGPYGMYRSSGCSIRLIKD